MLAGPVIATALYALARGVPMARITAATGLRAVDLLRVDARVPDRHMPALFQLLAERFPGQAIALEMASSIPTAFLGVLLHSLRHAEHLQSAFAHLVAFGEVLSSRLQLTVTRGEVESRLDLYHPLDEEDGGCASEFALCLGARLLRESLGIDHALRRVELAHEPHGPPALYRERFGAAVTFSAGGSALIVDTAALERPLATRDRSAFRLAKAHLERVLAHERANRFDAALAPVVDAIWRNAEEGLYEVGALARRLSITPRSLQRMVATRGTTPRALIDRIRATRAADLLRDSQRSIAEVAGLLGYTEETSFRRAFRRWTGAWPKRGVNEETGLNDR
ncbi:MAG: AraC family transcriptional regulator ligand-binding domain-containing protein [Nannocystaceae bacterium]|nr:AraC family transcriptional regulator ligand-binding domain-containing protein [Myxococcales bacterium]